MRRSQSCEGWGSLPGWEIAVQEHSSGKELSRFKHLPAAGVATAEGMRGRSAEGILEEEGKSQTT